MRPNEAKQYARSFTSRWHCAYACGDVNDDDSISDLVMRKSSQEVPKRKSNPRSTRSWLRQVKTTLPLLVKIERKNTDSTSDSKSEVPSTPSTIETISDTQGLNKASPITDSDEPIPIIIETSRVNSIPVTDVSIDSQFDELTPAPTEPVQRAYTYETSDLPSCSQSAEFVHTPIENTRRVHSQPNRYIDTIGPLRRQKRNPEREAFFKARVYDLGHGGDCEPALYVTSDNVEQESNYRGWPNDFYRTLG